MKNILIIILIAVVAVLGFLLLSKDGSNTGTAPTVDETSGKASVDSSSSSGKSIDLSSSGLNEVSKNILDDSSVMTFDVSDNNLTGSLPAEIRKLTNLEVLDASNNKMTGIPAEIGQLSKLREANFANNDLSGLPLEIGNLKNLETLDLRGNPNISKYDIGLIQPNIPNAIILVD